MNPLPPSGPDDYRDWCGLPYNAPRRTGYTVLPVLQFLWGHPWNDLALCYVHSLRPSSLRVTGGEITCDSRTWRVTVFLKDDLRTIDRIEQAVEVGEYSGMELRELSEKAAIEVP